MKKIILAAFAALTLSLGASAQGSVSFILQGGYQGSKLTNFDAAELANGFRIGAALDFEIVNFGIAQLSLQPGVNFSQKGVSLLGTFQNGNSIFNLAQNLSVENAINAAMHMNYIDIPVLVNARVSVPILGNLFVQAGPYVAFGIGSSTKLDTGNDDLNKLVSDVEGLIGGQKVDAFKSKLFDQLDYGLQFGGGIEFSRILISAGYQLGLKNIASSDNTAQENIDAITKGIQESLDSGTKNSSFYVSIGLRF